MINEDEPGDHLEVALAVVEPEVLEQTGTLGDHHQQPSAAGVVLAVRLEMVGQVGDPGRQKRDLHLGRTRVLGSPSERTDDLGLLLLRDRHRSPHCRRPLFQRPR